MVSVCDPEMALWQNYYVSGSIVSKQGFFPRTAGDVCPPAEHQPVNCRTCCCKSSDNVDFYHPEAAHQPECAALNDAKYKVSLVPTISSRCHHNYPFTNGIDSAYFSDLAVTSHGAVRLFDACVDEIIDNIFNYLTRTEEALLPTEELLAQETKDGILRDYIFSTDALEPGNMKRRSGSIFVSPTHSFLTLMSKLVSICSIELQLYGYTVIHCISFVLYSCHLGQITSGLDSVD